MKAKEYAERYKANPTDKELMRVAFDLLMETKELAEQRHVSTNAGLFGVIDEIANKWRAFVRLVNDPNLRTDGFELLIKQRFPWVYDPWKAYCQTAQSRMEAG